MPAKHLIKRLEKHKLLVHPISLSIIPVITTVVSLSYILAFTLCIVGFNVGYQLSTPKNLPVVMNPVSIEDPLLFTDTKYELEDMDEALNYDKDADVILADTSDVEVLGVSDKDATEYMNKSNYETTVAPVIPTGDKFYANESLQEVEINKISPSRSVNINNDLLEYILKIAFPVLAISLSVFGVNLLHSLNKPIAGKKVKK